ncbi:MAG: hypothetical protein NT001_07030, partial [Candidatus Woesearchaeota archaeon]|nr:hypothetical protein [Candidatus Woesearchaeota archaeon]
MKIPGIKGSPLFNRLQHKLRSAVDKAVDKINASSDDPVDLPAASDTAKAGNPAAENILGLSAQNKAAEAKFSVDSGGLSDYEKYSNDASEKKPFRPADSVFSFEKKPTAV